MTTSRFRSSRPGRPRALSWEHLLDVVDELGYDDFTVAAVAERLGVSDSTVYNYVDSRQQLRAAAASRALAHLSLVHDGVDDWVEYLVRVDLALRRLTLHYRGLARYYTNGPYLEESLQVFDTQIAQVQSRLDRTDENYAFVLASHASTITLSFLGGAEVDDATVRRVLEHALPALHSALDGQAPPGIDWRRLRAALAAAGPAAPRHCPPATQSF